MLYFHLMYVQQYYYYITITAVLNFFNVINNKDVIYNKSHNFIFIFNNDAVFIDKNDNWHKIKYSQCNCNN